jgi:hypothetical protein
LNIPGIIKDNMYVENYKEIALKWHRDQKHNGSANEAEDLLYCRHEECEAVGQTAFEDRIDL